MVRRLNLLLLGFLLLAFPAHAERRTVADVSEDFVAVTEGFSGAKLTVFGVLKSPADVAIVVEGPPAQAKVRAKARVLGVWINGEPETLEPVPSYYAVITSRPVARMVGPETARAYGLGADFLPFAAEGAGRGLVEAKKAQGLYRESPEGVKILENKLFRATIELPGSVPIGTYQAHIYEFKNGNLVASRTTDLRVAQVGAGAEMHALARQNPLLYGTLSLLLSLFIGGGAAWLLRKRS